MAGGKLNVSKLGLNGGWVPWYNLHKMYAGLLDAYRYCGSDKAKTLVIALTDWADGVTSKLSEAQMQKMCECEIGGMNEALADVYAITGKPAHLKVATRFNHTSVLGPLSKRQIIGCQLVLVNQSVLR